MPLLLVYWRVGIGMAPQLKLTWPPPHATLATACSPYLKGAAAAGAATAVKAASCRLTPLPLPVQAAAGTLVVLELGDVAGSWVTGSARRRHRKFGPALYCLDAFDSYQDDVRVGPRLSRGGAAWCSIMRRL